MENATKALLIAAAVLIAILIISLGLVVYNKASETVDSVDMSGNEVQAYNEKFDKYHGVQRGTEVNAMVKTVFNHNLQQSAAGETEDSGRFITVTGEVELAADAATLPTTMASTGRTYVVTVTHDPVTGLVTTIDVQPRT